MKKIKFLVVIVLLLGFGYVFFLENSNVFAFENDNSINENDMYTESSNTIYIYDASYELEDDNLYIVCNYNDLTYKFLISDYNFYSINTSSYYLGTINENLGKEELINGQITLYEDTSIIFELSFINVNCEKIMTTILVADIQLSEFLNLIDYDSRECVYHNLVLNTKTYFEKVKKIYSFYNGTMSLSAFDNNSNNIVAIKSLTKYNDSSIKNYCSSNPLWDSNNNRIDDPIVNYIPREYFFTEGERLEYGEEFGFYMKTVKEYTDYYYSTLNVFELKFIYPKGDSGSITNQNFFSVSFVPLFNVDYVAHIKNEYNDSYMFGSSNSFVASLLDLANGYSDFMINNAIENYDQPNQGDSSYNIEEDKGLCVSRTLYKIENYDTQPSFNFDDFENSGYYSLISSIPVFAPATLTLSIANEIIEVLNKAQGGDDDNLVTKEDGYEYTYKGYRDQKFHLKCYIKNVTFGFKTNLPLNSKLYIGRYSYADSVHKYEDKAKFIGSVIYQDLDDECVLQKVKSTLVMKLYLLSPSITELKTLIFQDENIFKYNRIMDYYTSIGELNFNGTNNSVIPVLFSTTDVRKFKISSYAGAKVTIRNQFGAILFTKYIGSEHTYFSFPFKLDERYFICLSPNPTVVGTTSVEIIADTTYSLSSSTMYFYMDAYDSVALNLNISASGFYDIETFGTDTELYVYKDDRLIDYNDSWYSLDEEMNEELESEAYLFLNLDVGNYYVIIGKNSSSSNSQVTITIT